MSVYDQAHVLAKAIKEAPEYKLFLEAKERMDKDNSAKEMLADFRKAQWELQKQKMSGVEIAPEQEKRISQMLEVIGLNLLVKEYLEAEYRFSVMIADVQKIIGEVMEPLLTSELLESMSSDEES